MIPWYLFALFQVAIANIHLNQKAGTIRFSSTFFIVQLTFTRPN